MDEEISTQADQIDISENVLEAVVVGVPKTELAMPDKENEALWGGMNQAIAEMFSGGDQ